MSEEEVVQGRRRGSLHLGGPIRSWSAGLCWTVVLLYFVLRLWWSSCLHHSSSFSACSGLIHRG